jgi:NADH-quinone oxidoreductase subunit J
MVLFLFVIMLLSLGDAQLKEGKITAGRVVGGLAAAGLFFVLMVAIARARLPEAAFDAAKQSTFGTLAHVGQVIYARYLLPFEAVSLLLLVAIVGAVVVAKSRI